MTDPTGRTMSWRNVLAVALVLAGVVAAAVVLAGCGSQRAAAPVPAESTSAAAAAGGSPAPQLTGGGLPPGCRCHSRVKWQVAMHKLFGPADCEKCHSANDDLMATQSSTMTAAHLAALRKRMRGEPVCLECHRQGGTSVPTRLTAMKGTLYCPTDGKLYSRGQAVAKGGAYFCAADETRLVDVDAVTAASEKQPSNAYCVACHPQTAELDQKHAGVAQAAGVADLSDCLSCHPSHSQCGSCHH